MSAWTTWNGTDEISVTNGYYIAIAETESDFTCERVGQVVAKSLVTYTITATLDNVTASETNPASITNADASKILAYTADEGYSLPESVTVTGATGSWDAETGLLIITNPTGNVSFTITGVEE